MQRLTLERGVQTRTACEGKLILGRTTLRTIERPWVPSAPGGAPFESSVPAGIYKLVPHLRSNGDEVLALVNPGLGVYHGKDERPGGVGRYFVLIHAANWVKEIQGCIAPGLRLMPSAFGPMVMESRKAMEIILKYVGDEEAELEIIGRNTYPEAA